MQLEISEKYLCVEKEQGRKEDVGMILLSEKNCIPNRWEMGGQVGKQWGGSETTRLWCPSVPSAGACS